MMEIFSVSTPWQDQALGQYCLEPGESHWVLCPDQLVITLEKGRLGTLHLQGTAPQRAASSWQWHCNPLRKVPTAAGCVEIRDGERAETARLLPGTRKHSRPAKALLFFFFITIKRKKTGGGEST